MSKASTGDAFAEQFRGYCDQYLGMARALGEAMNRTAGVDDATQRARAFNDGLEALRQRIANAWSTAPAGGAFAGAMPFGGMQMPGMPPFTPQNPFAAWNPLAGAGASPWAAGNPWATANPWTNANPWASANPWGAFASPPPPAPMAAQQELWQRIAQLADQSAQAQARLTAQWNEIITKALQRLGASAESLSNAAPTPESLRALYDKWVNIAETTYAEAAHAPQFAQAQAELGNAQNKLRTAQREFIERMAREFDLPTRAELNSLHEQLRELKKAVQELRKRSARSSGPAGS